MSDLPRSYGIGEAQNGPRISVGPAGNRLPGRFGLLDEGFLDPLGLEHSGRQIRFTEAALRVVERLAVIGQVVDFLFTRSISMPRCNQHSTASPVRTKC
jgi:hypothetical protein